MRNDITKLLKQKTYQFDITSPDGAQIIKKKYKGRYEGEAYDKLNAWLAKNEHYSEWEPKYKGVRYSYSVMRVPKRQKL